MQSQEFDVDSVPVSVKNVNFDGLSRTKPDFLYTAIKNAYLYRAKTFGDLLLRVRQAEDILNRMQVFKEVAVIVDIARSPDEDIKSGDGYDITFVVKEFGRLAASMKTQLGAQADAHVKTGIRMPNLFGSGEKLEAEYSHSSSEEKNASLSLAKPFPTLLESGLRTSLFHSRSPNSHARYLNTGLGGTVSYYCYTTSSILPYFSIHNKLEYEGNWREIMALGLSTPPSVRLDCGNSFKSAIRHVLTLDNRGSSIFPNHGTYANFLQEVAGLLGIGDAKYFKFDMDVQHNISLPYNMVLQGSVRGGSLVPYGSGSNARKYGISDKFFMGGPTSVRGFDLRGINVGREGISLGGTAYWAAALHLYSPILFVNRKFPMVENTRIHFFVNSGNLADEFLAAKIFKDFRLSYGAGLAIALGNFGRLEVNYCWPVKLASGDKPVKGVQVGLGIHFL